VVLLGILGFHRPGLLTPVGPYLPWFFMGTMVGVGALLDFAEFVPVLRRPHVVLLGTATQFTVMPLLGYAIARALNLPPALAFGFVLVGSVPGAMASNVIAYLAGADVAYSIAITTTSTFLAPILSPAATWLLAGQWLEIEFWTMARMIAELVVGPLLAGMLLRRLLRAHVAPLRLVCPALSTVCIALICAAVVAGNRDLLRELSGVLAAGVVLHNAAGFAGGWGAARLFALPERRRRTLCLEVGMQNAGLGAVVATRMFDTGTGTALPCALFASWCVVTASALAAYWRARSPGLGTADD
jgi:BASS family bile acid:Na+ symporter